MIFAHYDIMVFNIMNRVLEKINLRVLNKFIFRHIKSIEMIGVVMRIISFSIVSWLGPESPFMFVWVFNTIDAIILSWCSILKKDRAYTLLNIFWISVGLVGIARASGYL